MFRTAYYDVGAPLYARLTRRHPVGRCIYDDDWNICIVLDSARYDMLRDVLSDSERDYRAGSAWSRGSITTEWLTQTFREPYHAEVADTTMVTANPHSDTVFRRGHWLTNYAGVSGSFPPTPAVDRSAFANLYELWESHATAHGAVPPSVMRDATIEAYRTHGSRLVAHWLQPHEPFLAPDADYLGGGPNSENVWRALKNDEIDTDRVWQSYKATLSWTLGFVEDVLQAVDADVLITSDHGNAMGEWGVYGHPFGWPQPAVRKVPWVQTTAQAVETVDTSNVLDASPAESSVQNHLKALGYQ